LHSECSRRERQGGNLGSERLPSSFDQTYVYVSDNTPSGWSNATMLDVSTDNHPSVGDSYPSGWCQ